MELDNPSIPAVDLFDAALNPTRWPEILRRIATATGQTAIALSGQSKANLTGPFFSWGIDEDRIATFLRDYAHSEDNLALNVFRQAPLGRAENWEKIIDKSKWDQIPIARDLIHPMGLTKKFAMNLFWDGEYGGLLSVLGPTSGHPVTSSALELTTDLHRFLAPAFEITCRMALAERENRSLWDALSTLGLGLGLVVQTETGQIAKMNSVAETLLSSNGTPALQLHAARNIKTVVDDTFVLLDAPNTPILAIRVRMQVGEIGRWNDHNSSLLILLQFDRDAPNLWQLIKTVFGATSRQIEVGKLVLEGMPTSEIANRLGITSSTVETHIDRLCVQMRLANKTALRSWLEQIRAIV